jgi:hypothetical protein
MVSTLPDAWTPALAAAKLAFGLAFGVLPNTIEHSRKGR